MARTRERTEQARIVAPTGQGQPQRPLFDLQTETNLAALRDKLDWLENLRRGCRGRWDEEPDVEFW